MSENNPQTSDEELGPVDALIFLATRDGLGENLTWGDVRPVLLAVAQNPVGPRDCRRRFREVNDTTVLATMEDWFHRAASERKASAQKTERASSMITMPVQRTGLAVLGGVGIAMAVGTMTAGTGIPFLIAAGAVAGGGTLAGWRQSTEAGAQRDLADVFHRLEAIAKEERDTPKKP